MLSELTSHSIVQLLDSYEFLYELFGLCNRSFLAANRDASQSIQAWIAICMCEMMEKRNETKRKCD